MLMTQADRLDRLFHTLSDGTRRRIWDALGQAPGATTAELAARCAPLSRWAVMKHLAVMHEAGLVQTLPQGRRRRHYRDERALAPLTAWLERPT